MEEEKGSCLSKSKRLKDCSKNNVWKKLATNNEGMIINYRMRAAKCCREDDNTSTVEEEEEEEGFGDKYSWPPQCYTCSFCKREFKSAQALGGHMNIHRKEKAASKLTTQVITITTHHPHTNYYLHLPSNSLHHPQSHGYLQYPNPNLIINPNLNYIMKTSCFASNTSSSFQTIGETTLKALSRSRKPRDHLKVDDGVIGFYREKTGMMIDVKKKPEYTSGLLVESHDESDDLDLELRLGC